MGGCGELAKAAYVDVAERLDKVKTIAAFRGVFPYLRTTRQEDVQQAYLAGHEAGSRHAWNGCGRTGEPPGWEADEEEAVRNADPTMVEDLRRWSGEGKYARLEKMLQEMERELVRDALTAWLAFAGFCARGRWGLRPRSSWMHLRVRLPKGCGTSRS